MIFGLENRGETSFFMSCHFDQTIAILILHFLCFCARKRITGDCFVIRINKNPIFKTSSSKYKSKWNKPNPSRTRANSKLNNGMIFFISVFFAALFPHHVFPIHFYRVTYKWRICTEKHERIIWLIWAIVGQYTDKMTQKCVKNESFCQCSDTLWLKWVKWFTWGFQCGWNYTASSKWLKQWNND